MDVQAIRDYLNSHPDGIEIHMVDGTVYRIPHRDYLIFSPESGDGVPGLAPRRYTSSMIVFDTDGRFRLVNALLVAHVRPWGERGPLHRAQSA